MTSYIWSFFIYTLGAVGVLLAGYIVAKHFINSGFDMIKNPQKDFLKLEQGIRLEQKKSVYLLRAGNQRFLVASSPEGVTFLSELNPDNVLPEIEKTPQQPNNPTINNVSAHTHSGFDDNISYMPNQRAPQPTYQHEKQQMHPDLEAKLKYVNMIKTAINRVSQ